MIWRGRDVWVREGEPRRPAVMLLVSITAEDGLGLALLAVGFEVEFGVGAAA